MYDTPSNTSLTILNQACHVDLLLNGTNTTLIKLSPCPAGYTYDLETDRTFVTEWDLVCEGAERAEVSQMLMMIGQMVGAAFLPPLSDRFGRKIVLVTSQIVLFASGIGASLLPSFTCYAIMRFICVPPWDRSEPCGDRSDEYLQRGMAMARAVMSVEILPEESRYMAEVLGCTVWALGLCLIAPVAYVMQDMSWRYLYLALSLISIHSLLGFWLVDSLTYYGLALSSASLPLDRFLSFFLLSLAELPVAVIEYFTFNSLGRRRLCTIFHAVAAVSLIAGTIANYLSGRPGADVALMVFYFIGKLAIAGSYSTIFLFTPELYPTNLR
ncbi:solute carrier family 22 member 6-like [Pecten maximus]|uniref:solute carrier family 22 member 6-like n=1 Tax=Pecten maximus TaxID=6579 RepID=UPI00145862D7|nr:solute carrier family 22 member 6-like [Pecten maximus]